MADPMMLDIQQLGGTGLILGALYTHYRTMKRGLRRDLLKSVKALAKRISEHEETDNRRFNELQRLIMSRAPTVYQRPAPRPVTPIPRKAAP